MADPPFWRYLPSSVHGDCLFCRFVLKPLAWYLTAKILILFTVIMVMGAAQALGLL